MKEAGVKIFFSGSTPMLKNVWDRLQPLPLESGEMRRIQFSGNILHRLGAAHSGTCLDAPWLPFVTCHRQLLFFLQLPPTFPI
jgi:hypothetical protein